MKKTQTLKREDTKERGFEFKLTNSWSYKPAVDPKPVARNLKESRKVGSHNQKTLAIVSHHEAEEGGEAVQGGVEELSTGLLIPSDTCPIRRYLRKRVKSNLEKKVETSKTTT